MPFRWSLTIDCAHPPTLAAFWALALDYAQPPAPSGFPTWQDWFSAHGVPEDEWEDIAFLHDPDGVGPSLSLLKVPEGKTVKNRLHLDVQAGGGRATPHDVRWPRVEAAVARLCAAGATVLRTAERDGVPDHVVLADPEGNEFCVL